MAKLPLRRNESLMVALLLAVPMGTSALLHRLVPIIRPNLSEERTVFHMKDGVWTPGPRVPGGLWGLEVSAQGAVWSIPASRGGLCRLDNGRWTCYGRKQFGSRSDWLRGGFALLDEDVWAAGGEGVVRFDGQSWHRYPDALKTNWPAATAAGRSGIWIIDHYGNLSHSNGNGWSVQSLAGIVPTAPPAGKNSQDRPPRLAMTGDGHLWVRWRGLWRLDGDTWREVRSPGLNFAEVWPIGHNAENVLLWLWRTGEVAAVAPDGRIAARHGVQEMGFTESVRFNGVATSNGRVWVASSSGLLTFDGNRWTNLGLPPQCATLTDLALAPDGSAWVLAETRSFAGLLKTFGPALAVCSFPLVVIGLLIAAWLQGRAENALATQETMVAAAGHLPGLDLAAGQAAIVSQARSLRWMLPAMLVGLPLVAVAVEDALWRAWPTAPAWALHTGAVSLIVVLCLAIWLWTARRRHSESQPSRVRAALWEPAKWMFFLALLLFGCIVPSGWVDRLIPVAVLARYVKAAVVVLPALLIVFGRDIAAVLLVNSAVRAGDYDRAIRWIRRLSFGRPSHRMIGLEGVTHALAGRPDQAEPCIRQALARTHGSWRFEQVSLLGCLGEVLGHQGRNEEAQKCLQASIDMGDTDEKCSRAGLAELLLKQGTEPQKALELVDQAMRLTKGAIAKKVEPLRSATRAWALALLGRRQEAGEAIERATRARRHTHVAMFANAHLNVAMALLAMDQTERAAYHLREAHDVDPHGKYGAFALNQLQQMRVAQ